MYANKPQIIDETPGKKYYCACGESSGKPYCDGSHKGTGRIPSIVEIVEAKKLVLCDCGKSSNLPYCDGTHAKKASQGHSCCGGGHCT